MGPSLSPAPRPHDTPYTEEKQQKDAQPSCTTRNLSPTSGHFYSLFYWNRRHHHARISKASFITCYTTYAASGHLLILVSTREGTFYYHVLSSSFRDTPEIGGCNEQSRDDALDVEYSNLPTTAARVNADEADEC